VPNLRGYPKMCTLCHRFLYSCYRIESIDASPQLGLSKFHFSACSGRRRACGRRATASAGKSSAYPDWGDDRCDLRM